jgi:type VI protein secretion system component Hcp
LQRTIGHEAVQSMGQTHAEERQAGLNGTAFPLCGYDLSRIPIYPPPTARQTKRALDTSGDAYTREADWGAHQVLAAPAHTGVSGAPPHIQRSPDDSGIRPADAGKGTGGPREQTSFPTFVASIIGSNQGKFRSQSRLAGHKGQIEIQSLTVNSSETEMMVHLVKQVDETSPAFASAGRTGEVLTTAQFVRIRRNDRGDIEAVKTFDFTDGLVSSLAYSASEGIAFEAITLHFRRQIGVVN